MPLPGGRSLDLSERTLVMGILNLTPDSFADGGSLAGASAAIDAALLMEEQGADIIDIGGESTRPGAAPVPLDEELVRVAERDRSQLDHPLNIRFHLIVLQGFLPLYLAQLTLILI